MLVTGALLVGRVDVAHRLLDDGIALAWRRFDRTPSPLALAACLGEASLVLPLVTRGIPVNTSDGERMTALHHALSTEGLSERARAETVRALLENGAVPELRARTGNDAWVLAASLASPEIDEVMAVDGRRHGPRQAREARAAGIRDVCVHYDKADGFIYRVAVPDQPFFEGGDYDGAMPCRVEGAAAAFERLCERLPRVAWFRPFMRWLVDDHPFAFEDLVRAAPKDVRLVRFDERSNWDW